MGNRIVKVEPPQEGRVSSTEYVVCPWCGHKHDDPFEYKRGDYFCQECEKEFHVEVNEVVTWTTSPNHKGEQVRAELEAIRAGGKWVCPDCFSDAWTRQQGEIKCHDCGAVVGVSNLVVRT